MGTAPTAAATVRFDAIGVPWSIETPTPLDPDLLGRVMARIASADELQIAPRRRDGTLRNPRTIWVVRHGDDLYVRSVNGRTSAWFRGAQARHEAHIQASGVDKDVRLVEVDDLNEEIDAAYRTKYRRYAPSIIDAIVSPQARAATLRLVPTEP